MNIRFFSSCARCVCIIILVQYNYHALLDCEDDSSAAAVCTVHGLRERRTRILLLLLLYVDVCCFLRSVLKRGSTSDERLVPVRSPRVRRRRRFYKCLRTRKRANSPMQSNRNPRCIGCTTVEVSGKHFSRVANLYEHLVFNRSIFSPDPRDRK